MAGQGRALVPTGDPSGRRARTCRPAEGLASTPRRHLGSRNGRLPRARRSVPPPRVDHEHRGVDDRRGRRFLTPEPGALRAAPARRNNATGGPDPTSGRRARHSGSRRATWSLPAAARRGRPGARRGTCRRVGPVQERRRRHLRGRCVGPPDNDEPPGPGNHIHDIPTDDSDHRPRPVDDAGADTVAGGAHDCVVNHDHDHDHFGPDAPASLDHDGTCRGVPRPTVSDDRGTSAHRCADDHPAADDRPAVDVPADHRATPDDTRTHHTGPARLRVHPAHQPGYFSPDGSMSMN